MAPTTMMIASQKRTISESRKHDLRSACLKRIRTNSWKTPDKVNDDSIIRPIRTIIEDEMRRSGVFLESPCSEDNNNSNNMNRLLENGGCEEDMDVTRLNDDYCPRSNHFMTEDELFELLEELEDEIHTQQPIDYDAIFDMAQKDFEDQVADFEQWESNDFEQLQSFLCPLCCSANLCILQSGTLICCPNQPSCSMFVDQLHNLAWQEVRNRLTSFLDNQSVVYEDEFIDQLAQNASLME